MKSGWQNAQVYRGQVVSKLLARRMIGIFPARVKIEKQIQASRRVLQGPESISFSKLIHGLK